MIPLHGIAYYLTNLFIIPVDWMVRGRQPSECGMQISLQLGTTCIGTRHIFAVSISHSINGTKKCVIEPPLIELPISIAGFSIRLNADKLSDMLVDKK